MKTSHGPRGYGNQHVSPFTPLTICSSHLAGRRRALPCCNLSKALLLTCLLLVMMVLIQRYHHGKRLKEKTSNCCSWDGVGCDDRTGRVIALDVSRSYLLISMDKFLRNLAQLTIPYIFHTSLTTISQALYRKGANFIHSRAFHTRETPDCVKRPIAKEIWGF
ncbi:hypothetical protein M0R45_035666 [Rubus argutus]|uniref:Leucine-rich repeat-containing N-terminal plant-type domain-containing protein n=1 Tax=Rubus argutus TaxID=59490 RepID=A0AAW1VUX8_RUBAR